MDFAEQSQDEESSAVAQEEPEAGVSVAQGAAPPREQEEAGRRWLWEAEDSSTDEPTKELYPFSPAGQILAIVRAGRVASTLVCDRDT